MEQSEVSILEVFLWSTFTAIATGLGAIPLIFLSPKKELPTNEETITISPDGRSTTTDTLKANQEVYDTRLGVCNCIAAGTMIAASMTLVQEAVEDAHMHSEMWAVAGGILLGIAFVVVSKLLIREHNVGLEFASTMQMSGPHQTRERIFRMLLVLAVMTVHSFTEGVGMGVSFGRGSSLGKYITWSMAIHNIPEGMAIALVLLPKGVSLLRTAGVCIATSLPQPLMAVPGYFFVHHFKELLHWGLGFAAGAMVYVAAVELIPEALTSLQGPKHKEENRLWLAPVCLVTSFLAMVWFGQLSHA